jgi:hypothetical protein
MVRENAKGARDVRTAFNTCFAGLLASRHFLSAGIAAGLGVSTCSKWQRMPTRDAVPNMLLSFSLEFGFDLGPTDSLPLCICQRRLTIFTSEFVLQIFGRSFTTHDFGGSRLQSCKHFGQSGKRGIRFQSHTKSLAEGFVTRKRDEILQIVILKCDNLQNSPSFRDF